MNSRNAQNETSPNKITVTTLLVSSTSTSIKLIVNHDETRLLNVRTIAGSKCDSGFRLSHCPMNSKITNVITTTSTNAIVPVS